MSLRDVTKLTLRLTEVEVTEAEDIDRVLLLTKINSSLTLIILFSQQESFLMWNPELVTL